MRPEAEQLEPRDNPAPIFVRTVVAIEVQSEALTPDEAEAIRARMDGYLRRLAPQSLEVVVVDGAAVARLQRAAKRSQKLQAFVVQFFAGAGQFNWWGESNGADATVYVGGHRSLPPDEQVGQIAVTAAHELGHVFGLDHSHDPGDVMSLGPVNADAAGYLHAPPVWRVLHRREA